MGDHDSAVQDVRRILQDIRRQYDDVKAEAERKEEELSKLREAIRVSDRNVGSKGDEVDKLEDTRLALIKQLDGTNECITEAQTNKKVEEKKISISNSDF